MDDDFGVVKEEIVEEDCPLPCFNGRVVSWLVSADGGSVMQTQAHSAVSLMLSPLFLLVPSEAQALGRLG